MADPTREGAYDLLTAVFDQHRPLDEALDALSPSDLRDRAAAHRLAAAVLRRTGTLDAALEPFLRKTPPDPVRQVLRIGAGEGAANARSSSSRAPATVPLSRTRGAAAAAAPG